MFAARQCFESADTGLLFMCHEHLQTRERVTRSGDHGALVWYNSAEANPHGRHVTLPTVSDGTVRVFDFR